MRNLKGGSTSLFAILIGLSAASPAYAQVNSAADSVEDGTGEIIVTAQRRAENIQDVPVAVTAIGTELLKNANIVSVMDLPKLAPSLNVQRSSRTTGTRLGVRGVGTFGSTALEPSVGVFVDEGYVARAGAVIGTMLDMASAELLRGPQGTLFGRNASVGALSLRSVAPKDNFEAQVTGEIGNGDRYRVEGIINAPLSEGTALRVAGMYEDFGGFIYNKFDDKTYGGRRTYVGKASLRTQVGDAFTNTLRVDYTKLTGDADMETDTDGATIAPGGLARWAAIIGTPLPDLVQGDDVINHYYAPAKYRDRQIGITNTAELELGGDYTARLISMYRDWKSYSDLPHVVTAAIPLVDLIADYGSKTHTQELQLVSPTAGRLNFVVGLYYLHDKLTQDENYNLSPQYCDRILPLFIPTAVTACQSFPDGVDDSRALFQQTTEAYAAYGQSNFKITDQLELVTGIRYTKERKRASEVQSAANPGAALFVGTENTLLKLNSSRTTYRVGLNWRPTDDILTYVSYNTGFKAGGFNSGVGRALGQARLLRPETVDSYEAGAKTSFLDGHVIANLAIFRMNVKGFQDRSINNGAFSVRNAGDIRNQGVELEGRIIPVRSISLNYAVAYLDSEFSSYPGAPNLPGLPGSQDLTGKRPTFTPKWVANVGAQYDSEEWSNGMSWMARFDLAYTGRYNAGLVNDTNPQTIQSSTTLLSARISLFGRDKGWTLSAFGQNLTNADYCLQKYGTTFSAQFGLSTPGNLAISCISAQRRTYGLSMSARF